MVNNISDGEFIKEALPHEDALYNYALKFRVTQTMLRTWFKKHIIKLTNTLINSKPALTVRPGCL
jgi:hypothetical protein